MDLGTALIGLVCIAICAIPYILVRASRKKLTKQLLDPILELAALHNSSISQHETSGCFGIAIDEAKGFLFFNGGPSSKSDLKFIDLSTVKTCEVIKQNRTHDGTDYLDRLFLRLESNNHELSPIELYFFRSDVNYQVNGELQSVEKWNDVINKRIS